MVIKSGKGGWGREGGREEERMGNGDVRKKGVRESKKEGRRGVEGVRKEGRRKKGLEVGSEERGKKGVKEGDTK